MSYPPNKDLSVNTHSFEDKGNVFDVAALWQLLQSRRWFIFTVTGIVMMISAVYSLGLPTVYTAHVKILVEKIDPSAFQNPELLKPQQEYGPMYYQTRAELVQSRQILQQAAGQLNLVEHYKKAHKRIRTNEQAVRFLNRWVDSKILRGTQIIELSVTDTDPEWAMKLADAISENFIKESWRERLFVSDQLLKWFPKEGETLEKNSPISQLRKLEKEDAIASLPSVLNDPVLGSIKKDRLVVDAQIRELSRRYTPEHPKMKELLSRAEYLESEMKTQIEKIIGGLKSGLAGEFGISNVKIVEKAEIPDRPSGPKRLRLIFLSTLLSFMGSILFLAILRYLDRNIRVEEDLEKIPLPFLGYLPLIAELNGSLNNGRSKKLLDHILSDSKLDNEINNVRVAVLFSMPAERSKLLMCTSAIPEEGKTTVASVLAISLAEGGEKVILIDADMRKPSLHRLFGLENKRGLSNYLVGSAKLKDIVHPVDKVSGLHVITAGETTPSPALLLSSVAVDRLIHELEPSYGKIIFDVPPSLHIADGLILAGKVHGTILVFDAGKVHQNVGKKLKDKITLANGIIIGGVINRTDYRKLTYPYHQYYHRYDRYYGISDQVKTSDETLTEHSVAGS